MSDVNVNLDVAPVPVTVTLGTGNAVTVTVTLAEAIGVPPGGSAGDVLTKTGPGPSDQAWAPASAQSTVDAAIAAHVNALDPHPGYTTPAEAAAAAPVQSVAGKVGAVSLVPGDIGGLAAQLAAKADLVDGKVPAEQLPATAAGVASVNGQTGVVVLTKAHVGLGNADNTADLDKPVSSATQAALNGKSDAGHTHAIANVTGLQAALDGKSATGHTHTLAQITDVGNAASRNVGSAAGTVCAGDDARLSDARTPTAHTHTIANVTGLQAALDGKSAAGHGHAIADITGLQAELDGKAAAGHNHDAVYVPKQRYQTLSVPAGAMTPATTAGAAAAAVESATHRVNYDVFDFDGSAAESVWFGLQMPDQWDRGTVKVKLTWTPATGGTGAVVWGVAAAADSDDDAIDTAVGTEVTVTDAVLAVGDVHVTAATPAVTVGGSPALGDWIWFRVRRLPTDAGDTMTQDARLIGVTIQWRESATEAGAW